MVVLNSKNEFFSVFVLGHFLLLGKNLTKKIKACLNSNLACRTTIFVSTELLFCVSLVALVSEILIYFIFCTPFFSSSSTKKNIIKKVEVIKIHKIVIP